MCVHFKAVCVYTQIPNPLFDLAGITCGHFLVPFWTFFGATLIGKAIVKMHIQVIKIVFSCTESLVTEALTLFFNCRKCLLFWHLVNIIWSGWLN